MEITNLSYLDMFYVYLFLIIPIILLVWLKVGIVLDLVVSISRMSVQLILIGIYLKFIFEINSLLLNITWIFAMLIVANFSILRQSNLSVRKFFICTFVGLSFATSIILAIFVALVCTTIFNLLLTRKIAFDSYGMLRHNIFRK